MKKKPYVFNKEVLGILCKSLQETYIGKKMEIWDIYIMHNDEYTPRLVIRSRLEDGTEIKTDLDFFEYAE